VGYHKILAEIIPQVPPNGAKKPVFFVQR